MIPSFPEFASLGRVVLCLGRTHKACIDRGEFDSGRMSGVNMKVNALPKNCKAMRIVLEPLSIVLPLSSARSWEPVPRNECVRLVVQQSVGGPLAVFPAIREDVNISTRGMLVVSIGRLYTHADRRIAGAGFQQQTWKALSRQRL
jgi:hypothetical protein